MLCLLEVVFPPIPSELVLPLAGYQVERGSIGLVAVLVASTLGSYLGALLLYWLGARLGVERTARVADRVPLLEGDDVRRASGWFERHSGAVVFTGRFVPGVRSLVSLPAGAARMPLVRFSALTVLGSGLWNVLLVSLGMLLGTQYELVEEYAGYLDVLVHSLLVVLLVVGVRRSLRRRQAARS